MRGERRVRCTKLFLYCRPQFLICEIGAVRVTHLPGL